MRYHDWCDIEGLHCLEMAKTESNAFMTSSHPESAALLRARRLLVWAQGVIQVSGTLFGDEGTEDSGPNWEVQALDMVLTEEEGRTLGGTE